ncbi:MAG TPA: sigma-54 dependent transcriptional regulator [Thermoanaerobaculia bacterium]|nr:sigma-54 dependent transcriptional regulator [Thermoanaerobaculia bacterium]
MISGKIAIVEDDRALLDQMRWALKREWEVASAEDAVAGLGLLAENPDLFLIDLRLPPSHEPSEGLGLLRGLRERRPDLPVVVMTGEKERSFALKAVELGAYDFFRKPVNPSELTLVLARAMERRRLVAENQALREEMAARATFDSLVGSSAAMRTLFRAIEKVAPSDATVLIAGESGTGKELVAQALHRGSPRAGGPFVAVNSSALPEALAESELFGHEKGAFTGAVASRPGKFELAHRGTLFLDEAATLSPAVQAKLLRVLETRQFERVGGTRTIAVDIRLVVATNEDLQKRAADGTFREDLYYRLNTVALRTPPLRERRGDIPLLLDHFREKWGRHHRRPPRRFAPAALECLIAHDWPGNVRELEHLVEMLTLMVEHEEIAPADLPPAVARGAAVAGEAPAATLGESESLPDAVERFERELLAAALGRAGGVKAKAARELKIDSNQIRYLCRKHGL